MQRTVRCSFDKSVVSLVVHGNPDRHRSLPSIQSTTDTRRHQSLYSPQSKPPASLPLVGKYLQVSLTIRAVGVIFLIITPRNAPPQVASAPALSDTQPIVHLAWTVCLSLLTRAFCGSYIGRVINLVFVRGDSNARTVSQRREEDG